MEKQTHKGRIAVLIIIMAIIAVYVTGLLVFFNRYPFRTYVNNQNVTMLSPAEVTLSILKSANQQTITLIRHDGSKEVVPFERLGIFAQPAIDMTDIKTHPATWFTSIFHRTDIDMEIKIDYDYDKLKAAVNELDCVKSKYDLTPSSDYVAILDDGTYQVLQGTHGIEVNEIKLIEVLCNSIQNQEWTIDLSAEGCYKKHLLKEQDIDRRITADNFVANDVKVDFGLNRIEVIPKSVINDSIYVGADGYSYIKYATVYKYIVSLTNKYNTIGNTRTFVTTMGNMITLEPKSDDNFLGWELNCADTASNVCRGVVSENEPLISAVWVSKGKGIVTLTLDNKNEIRNDFGDTYIEIDINRQHMWVYKDGGMVTDTDIVTGTDEDGLRTPTGMFRTLDWNTEYTMHGDYGQAFAHYFIRITSAGVGIHDASWRSEYGGTYYKTSGSHGCINTPYDRMRIIYEALQERCVGDSIPVIVY